MWLAGVRYDLAIYPKDQEEVPDTNNRRVKVLPLEFGKPEQEEPATSLMDSTINLAEM